MVNTQKIRKRQLELNIFTIDVVLILLLDFFWLCNHESFRSFLVISAVSYLFVWFVQFLVLEHIVENCGCCFACFYLPRTKTKRFIQGWCLVQMNLHQTIVAICRATFNIKWHMHVNVCIWHNVNTHLTSIVCLIKLQNTHLLSCESLMPTSFCRPSKKEMSLAAIELPVTKLLRIPQMLTTTSLEGSFCRPSTGSLVTRLFTNFEAR